MTRIDRLDPRHKLMISCALIALLAAGLGWWLLAQISQSHMLADQAMHDGARTGSRAAAALRAHHSHVMLIGWLGVGAVALCAALLGRWLSEELTRPLREAAEMALRVGGGDLSSHLRAEGDGDDAHLMRAMQDMNDKLGGMVNGLRSGFEDMVKDAGGIATSQGRLAAQSARELAALKTSASALQQMSEQLQMGAEQAQEAEHLAREATHAADSAIVVAEQISAAMEDTESTAARVKAMTSAIDDIAFQSNMLALSTAVETARAGHSEGGLGMLAFEVRMLARRSAEAARDMRALQEQAASNAGAGVDLAARAGLAMREVAGSVQRAAHIASAVAATNAQHGAALEAANGAVAALERSAQETATMLEQSATAAATLRDRAVGLGRKLTAFKLTRLPLRPGAHMYLAASNPDLMVRPFRERRGQTRIAAVKL